MPSSVQDRDFLLLLISFSEVSFTRKDPVEASEIGGIFLHDFMKKPLMRSGLIPPAS